MNDKLDEIAKRYSWDTTPSKRIVNWGDVADLHNEEVRLACEEWGEIQYEKGKQDGVREHYVGK
jgi:hypothetical protein